MQIGHMGLVLVLIYSSIELGILPPDAWKEPPNPLCANAAMQNQAALLAVVLINVIFFAFFFFPCPEGVGRTFSLPSPFSDVA
jgi:hypothetical protein